MAFGQKVISSLEGFQVAVISDGRIQVPEQRYA